MIGLFKKKKNGFSADSLHGKAIKYVTERIGTGDRVIGKSGALIIKEDELLVFSSSDVVFRGKKNDLKYSELLSGDGIIISGADIEHGGEERTVVAYYTYYL